MNEEESIVKSYIDESNIQKDLTSPNSPLNQYNNYTDSIDFDQKYDDVSLSKVGEGVFGSTDNTDGIQQIDGNLQSKNFVTGTTGWRLKSDGTLEATGATLAGALTASSGAIGGWTIDATSIYTAGMKLNSTDQRIEFYSSSLLRTYIDQSGDNLVLYTKSGVSPFSEKGVILYRPDDTNFYLAPDATANHYLGLPDAPWANIYGTIGDSTHKQTVYCSGLSACPLPTIDSPIEKIQKVSEPKEKKFLKNPESAHFEMQDKTQKRKYFDIDDLPDEVKFTNDTGKQDVDIIRTVGFLFGVVRELSQKVITLEKSYAKS